MKLKINKNVFFDDITHSYINNDDKILIGVTSLMRKHGLAPDYSNVDADTLNRKAAYGSAVHKSIERYIKGESVESTPELEAYKAAGINALASEYLVSDNETVASSVDIVSEELDLIDVKTTSRLHNTALQWQLSIYAYLFELQNPGLHVRNLYALHIKKSRGRIVSELVGIERLPDSEVEELIRCEREGRIYSPSLPAEREQDRQLQQLYDIEMFISEIEEKARKAKAERDEMLAAIYAKMEAGNLKKIETDRMTITRVLPSVRVSVDSRMLQSDYPQIYDAVKRETETKGSIRIKIK